NDGNGHLVGDEVLASVGHRLRQVLRRSDVRCRYGGDEFLVILPETPAAGAARVADWIRTEMQQVSVKAGENVVTPTLSIGAATAGPGERAEALLERADRALYAAKAAGRDCVRMAPPRVDTPTLVPQPSRRLLRPAALSAVAG
ncbi:MAG TPA: diguanylate cyclase, partial [Vicinamibacterales bacterium]